MLNTTLARATLEYDAEHERALLGHYRGDLRDVEVAIATRLWSDRRRSSPPG
jgi:hypothetical protein